MDGELRYVAPGLWYIVSTTTRDAAIYSLFPSEILELALNESLDGPGRAEWVLLEHKLIALDERVRLHEDLAGLQHIDLCQHIPKAQ